MYRGQRGRTDFVEKVGFCFLVTTGTQLRNSALLLIRHSLALLICRMWPVLNFDRDNGDVST